MNRTLLNFWTDVASLVAMLGLLLTGGLVYFVLPPGSGRWATLFGWDRHQYGQLHFYFAVAAVTLLVLHVALHWRWVCCVVAKAQGREEPSAKARAAWAGVVAALVLGMPSAGVWWASSHVVRNAEGAGSRGSAQSPRHALNNAETPSNSGPLLTMNSVAPSPHEHGSHEACTRAATVNGRTSLSEAAQLGGLSAAAFARAVGLPENAPPDERLGRLKRRYGLDLHAVREQICSTP
jgi:hypothetical protein